ncbi:cilia- and flagella-associated protein 77 [Aulostomus maculatus]
MSSPRVGVVRDSMLTNLLLAKASVGQTRSTIWSLPGPDFTFGTSSSLVRDGGMAEVLSSWQVQSGQGRSAPHRPLVPDFISLNRNAVRSGLGTSKELSQYRAQRDGTEQNPTATESPMPRCPAVPNIRFGVTTRLETDHAPQIKGRWVVVDVTNVPVRPPSPLTDLLSHQYGRRWLDQQLHRTSHNHQQKRVSCGDPGLWETTRVQQHQEQVYSHVCDLSWF